jgi:hypothetical protein
LPPPDAVLLLAADEVLFAVLLLGEGLLFTVRFMDVFGMIDTFKVDKKGYHFYCTKCVPMVNRGM